MTSEILNQKSASVNVLRAGYCYDSSPETGPGALYEFDSVYEPPLPPEHPSWQSQDTATTTTSRQVNTDFITEDNRSAIREARAEVVGSPEVIQDLSREELETLKKQLRTLLEDAKTRDEKVQHAKDLKSVNEALGRRSPQRWDELEFIQPYKDASCLLGKGLLYRGGNGFLGAETGIGKSNIAVGAMLHWSIGLPFLGIPAGGMYRESGLKILYIQAENQESDAAHQRESYLTLQELAPHVDLILTNTRVWNLDDAAGSVEFPRRIEEHLDILDLTEDFVPDLLIIDPLFSYAGGDVNAGKDMSEFLRNAWLPVTNRRNIGAIWVHHANKPSKESAGRDTSAYILGGSSELANFARFVIGALYTSDPTVVRLVGAKNVAHKVDWKEPREHYISHVGGEIDLPDGGHIRRIAWRDATEDEIESAKENAGRNNVKDRNESSSSAKKRRQAAIVDIIKYNHWPKSKSTYNELVDYLALELPKKCINVEKATIKKDLWELRQPDRPLEGFSWEGDETA
jgi:RecA-family ATPase